MPRTLLFWFVISYVAMCSISAQALAAAPVKLIVSEDVDAQSLSKAQLRSIFSMRETRWPNNQRIRVFVLAQKSPIHKAFTQSALGVFPYQLKRIWDKNVFTGIGEEPVVVGDESEMIRQIQATPGAIGYIAAETDQQGARVLEIE